MRRAVESFSHVMEEKIAIHDDTKGTEGWLEPATTVDFLVNRLEDEMDKVNAAVIDCDSEMLANTCVDIANFAMMIYDRLKYNGKA